MFHRRTNKSSEDSELNARSPKILIIRKGLKEVMGFQRSIFKMFFSINTLKGMGRVAFPQVAFRQVAFRQVEY